MKRISIGLAFCACLFIGMGYYVGFGMSAPASGPLPANMVAFAAFGIACGLCTLLAVFRAVPAALMIWIAAIVYCIVDFRQSPSWMVEDHIFRFALWPVLFLTLAGWAEEHKQPLR
jgi:hypothetical protein